MAITRIDERAAAYGIPHELVDGNDILAVYDVARRMVDRARAGEGASLIGIDTMRIQGHAQHDDARYVPKRSDAAWSEKDPIARFRRHLVETDTATEKDLDDIDAMTKSYAARKRPAWRRSRRCLTRRRSLAGSMPATTSPCRGGVGEVTVLMTKR